MNEEHIKKAVRKRYADLSGGCGCESRASCCDEGASTTDGLEEYKSFGYDTDEAKRFFESGGAAGLSCGNPFGIAKIKEGETVLDLGSGAGFDCHLASMLVGRSGRVIGVDMTPEMIEKARAKVAVQEDHGKVEFRLGEIERLPIEDESIDVIISNCVINLSPDKRSVFEEAYRVLRPGGRIAVSDVIAIQKLPDEIADDPDMHCSCIAGAVSAEELESFMREAGFEEIEIRPKEESREIVDGWAPDRHIGNYIISAEIRAEKPTSSEK